ncbi:MAG: AbrB/MazE/SpoVT family DNA-binding domain-containing protein [Candidatus Diapherotrites archaeon]|nr:AbrB/MazE/SpoVT family DNA-binding domain-containing protein [Candidatus Diapherotrites archaeon]
MYESITIMGERGQITIPKSIREIAGLNPKDKLIVKIEEKKIVVEKPQKEKEELIKEYFEKYSWLEKEVDEEWKHASKEADVVLDDC